MINPKTQAGRLGAGTQASLVKRTIIFVVVALIALSALFFFHGNAKPHSVTLSWHSPQPVSGVTVVSYNVYRSTTPGGPYVRLASGITALRYDDRIVNPGRTYFYVVTSVDQRGRESRYSNESQAVVP